MKKVLIFILILTLIALPLVSCVSDSTETETESAKPETEAPVTSAPVTSAPETEPTEPEFNDEALYVGYGRECITPYASNGKLKSGLTLTGYAEPREAKTVSTDMYVSCTAVKDKDGEIALIFTYDLHAMTPNYAENLKMMLNKHTKVKNENIILNVTHTHAVPHTSTIEDYVSSKTLIAAKSAIEDLTLVTDLYTGNVKIENMNFIRRYIYDEKGTPIAHIAENDPYMPTVRFVREGDKKDVILCNWAAHCDTVKRLDRTTISADYVAYFRDKVEKELDAYVAFHLGASGDVNPSGQLVGEPRSASADTYGNILALKFLAALDSSLERNAIKSHVDSRRESIKVYFDHSTDDKGEAAIKIMNLFWGEAKSQQTPEVRKLLVEGGFKDIYDAMYTRARYRSGEFERLTVGALSIGNVAFGIAPYEMFAVNGKNIKDSADEFDLAFMCAYSNGMIGYIASEDAFAYNIYEVYSRLYVKETATVLQDTIIAMIDELAKE